jgi:hypothetical protein
VFLVNSRFPLLSATPTSSDSTCHHQRRPPFSRSYGGNLPSSLTTVRPSPRYSLPDHLCRFRVRAAHNSLEAFLGSIGSLTSPDTARHHVSPTCVADLPTTRATRLPRHNHRPGSATFLRHPIAHLLPTEIPNPAGSVRRLPPPEAVSAVGFSVDAVSRVREYQPVVHRLRLSASP